MSDRVRFAAALAERLGAGLIGVLANPPPFMPASLGEGAAYVGPDVMQAQQAANEARTKRLRADYDALAGGRGIQCSFFSAEGDPGDVVGDFARGADLTIVGQSHGEGLEAIAMEHAEQIIVAAGGPVLVLPHAVPVDPDFAKSWLIAWDGGKEAARALGFALPFLERAERVVLLAAGEEYHASADLAVRRLAMHGVAAECEKLTDPDGSIGDLLLAAAETKGCTAMVMGAYGHSRFRELITGGATISIVRHARIPVLFSA